MKRRIVQVALVGAVLLAASAPAHAIIPYLGGRVMPTVSIIPVRYGANSSEPSGLLQDLVDYLRGAKNPIGKQSLYAQYGITDAQRVGVFPPDGPVDNNPRALTDTEIRNYIHAVQQ